MGSSQSTYSFTANAKVVLADTDAAGVVYFSRVFDIAHRCYEAMMEERGLPLSDVLATGHYAFPIVAATAELSSALRLGDRLEVRLTLAELGDRSFRLAYQLQVASTDRPAATVGTTHVAIDVATGRAIALPAEVVTALGRG